MLTVAAFALKAFDALPGLIQAGMDITSVVSHASSSIKAMQDEKRDPTQAEWDALDAAIAAKRAELHSK